MRWVIVLLAALITAAAVVNVLRPPALVAPQAAAALLARMDADGSGTVSPEEYRRCSDGIVDFSIYDIDGSGALTDWEVEQILFRISPDTPQPNLLPRVW
jgi:hypothetical protein